MGLQRFFRRGHASHHPFDEASADHAVGKRFV